MKIQWELRVAIWCAIIALIGIILFCSGCAESHVSMCRHRAVECALVYAEVDGADKVGIAIGPSSGTQWHGQAFVDRPTGREWIINMGHYCEIGPMEKFTPEQFFTVRGFLDNQFPNVK